MNRRGFLKLLGYAAAAPVAAKVLPSVAFSSPAEPVLPVSQYADYVSFEDLVMGCSIDPCLIALQKELNYRLALTLDTLVGLPAG